MEKDICFLCTILCIYPSTKLPNRIHKELLNGKKEW